MTSYPFRHIDLTSKQDVFDYVCEHLRNQGRRAVRVDSANCLYRSEDGALACAIGAMFTENEAKFLRSRSMMTYAVNDLRNFTEMTTIKTIIDSGIDITFLSSLQRLHDLSINWTETGIYEGSLLSFASQWDVQYRAPIQLS